MIPLLAPLLGSLAGSLLPATLGSGIAGALGLKGAAGALVASAAPKAIGAGIGTLLAGGDLGDAALNAVGFGAAGSLLGGAGSTGAPATSPRPTMRPDTLISSMPAPSVVPTAAASEAASTAALPNLARSAQQIAEALGGGQQSQSLISLPTNREPRRRPMDNPILAPLFQTGPTLDGPMSTPATVPVVGGGEGGIGTIPMGDQSLMSNDRMLAGMSPEQSDMIRRYLGSRNMVGFA